MILFESDEEFYLPGGPTKSISMPLNRAPRSFYVPKYQNLIQLRTAG